ncbi:hypothetical protein Hanom_Chr10g00922481 [Helianthus anomalus]
MSFKRLGPNSRIWSWMEAWSSSRDDNGPGLGNSNPIPNYKVCPVSGPNLYFSVITFTHTYIFLFLFSSSRLP